ncbi:MAG: hypothetical protein J5X23_19980 [Candidatus Accumulibacter sp.]|uniref:hypothetical protein n=1 Tax=Accumulibacter sp. TaxID=2053492 RepID=UPI001B18A497|nr:hypothetical protein [Accumulibacter sp.]MBO3717203.1 hypothetical protein [Accumulibacter sp.]
MTQVFSKLSAALLLFSCFLLAGADAAALAAEEKHGREATLHYHFRPIVTLRTSLVGASAEDRVRRSLLRIESLTPSQMAQPIERTPFTVDGKFYRRR